MPRRQPTIWARNATVSIVVYPSVMDFLLRVTARGADSSPGADRPAPNEAMVIEWLNAQSDALVAQALKGPTRTEGQSRVFVTAEHMILAAVNRSPAPRWSLAWAVGKIIRRPPPDRFKVWFTLVLDRRTGRVSGP